MRGLNLIRLVFVVGGLAVPGVAQTLVQQPAAMQSKGDAAGREATFRSYTRLVTLELVVKDSKGNHMTGLKPEDFQVFEQTPSESKQKREQKIAEFREIHVKDLGSSRASAATTEAGVYTNAVSMQQNPVPPTIVLVDGLNTPVQFQMQVHAQMLKMLRKLPTNVPVAVFLLGDRLTMLQGFTTDPRLLQVALSRAISNAGKGVAQTDPSDDPDAPGNSMSGFSYLNDPVLAQMIAAAQTFDQHVYATQMTARVNRTAEALISLTRNVAGFPGRKNLLWMSTAFPISLNAFGIADSASQADFQGILGKMNRALSEANVAVYPIDVGGVQTLQAFQAGARPADASPGGISGAIHRNVEQLNSQRDVMEKIAQGTGGKVCAGDNDLADCVRKAMDDSSEFYEISYYPNSSNWNGAYRQIFLKSRVQGTHLAYRNWYVAAGEDNPDPRVQSAELQGDCDDYLDATGIPFTARILAPERPDQLKFSILIHPAALAFQAMGEDSRSATLDIAVCTLNEKRWPQKIMNYPVNVSLSKQQYDNMVAAGGITRAITVPGPKPAAVRLLVKDITTGKLGSILISTDDAMQATR